MEWRIAKDKCGRLMFGIEDENEKMYLLSYSQNNKLDAPIRFYLFDTLQRNYWVDFIKHTLGVYYYRPSATRIKEGRAELANLIKTRDQNATENIPLKHFLQLKIKNTLDSANNVEMATTAVIDDFEQPEVRNTCTQTADLTFRVARFK